MTITMKRKLWRLGKETSRAVAGDTQEPKKWAPPGGIEIYVHSMLSDPYGGDDSAGLDAALTDENIAIARKCREIQDEIESGSEDREEGLRKIGEMIVGEVKIVATRPDSLDQTSEPNVKKSEVFGFEAEDDPIQLS